MRNLNETEVDFNEPDISIHTSKKKKQNNFSFDPFLDEFLCFEESSQIQNLPSCQAQKAAHSKYAEE